MTMVVRDEGDVLEANLRAHHALGVDTFAVLDNGSTDSTPEILERWRQAGLADVTTDPDATVEEVFREWPTRLARKAASELDANWVINNDADEFWLPLSGDLKTTFAAVGDDVHGMMAPRLEFVPRPDGPEPFWERMTVRERHTRVLPKVAHRATDDVAVGPGSHHVLSPTLGLPETAGRPSMRGLRRRPAQPRLIAPAANFECVIMHLPLRSFDQFRNRLEIGLRISQSGGSDKLESVIEEAAAQAGERWHDLLAERSAEEARGELVPDTSLRELLRAVTSDSGEQDGSSSRFEFAPAAGELERARTETRNEALRGLVHNHAQALGERDAALGALNQNRKRLAKTEGKVAARDARIKRARRRIKRARRRIRQLERRVEGIQSSRWWRLRPRLPGSGKGKRRNRD